MESALTAEQEQAIALKWFRSRCKESEKPSVIDRDSTLCKKAAEMVEDCGCKAAEKREHMPDAKGKAELEYLNPIIEALKETNKALGEIDREKLKAMEAAPKPKAEVSGGR